MSEDPHGVDSRPVQAKRTHLIVDNVETKLVLWEIRANHCMRKLANARLTFGILRVDSTPRGVGNRADNPRHHPPEPFHLRIIAIQLRRGTPNA